MPEWNRADLRTIRWAVWTEAGYFQGHEVTLVDFDPANLTREVAGKAKEAGVGDRVYLPAGMPLPSRESDVPVDRSNVPLLVRQPPLLLRRLEAENGFAFFHQLQVIARDRFQIGGIVFQQRDLPREPRERSLLLGELRAQLIVAARSRCSCL